MLPLRMRRRDIGRHLLLCLESEFEFDAPESNDMSGFNATGLDPLTRNERAVQAPQITDFQFVVGAANFGVTPRHGLVPDDELAIRGPPENDDWGSDGELENG